MFVNLAFKSALNVKVNPSISMVNSRPNSFWAKVEKGPEDPILGITVAFNKDTSPSKINLGVGAYRDDNGKPYILSCVREAEKRLFDKNLDHEYLAIGGHVEFNKLSQKLLLGEDNSLIKEGKVVSAQALSGTGGLRVGADFLSRFLPKNTQLLISDPTWANHIPIFKDAGFTNQKTYRYYNKDTCGLDFKGFVEDLKAAPEHSVVLFHTCAHNPTGVDPTPKQWEELLQVSSDKKFLNFFDTAYQGFATGDPEKDAAPVRLFAKNGLPIVYSQSFAKNFGLYGERIGSFGIISTNPDEAVRLESQLKILVRPMYSNPPLQGARIVSTILSDAALTKKWREEVKIMADRIITMRQKLVDGLKREGSKRNWQHVIDQIGMFCYSGISPQQVDKLAVEHHIYMTRNGRISIAGISSKNVDYLAKALHEVTK